MECLRTPDHCFENLPDFPFKPHYTEMPDGAGGNLRVHHVDEGPADGPVVLMMHGEPSWSYLYRKMIPVVVAGGCRVVAPDLVGFGRSDKPAQPGDYTYEAHVGWMKDWLQNNDLKDITLFCQDWGGLIGLRLVADLPERFARVVAANTMLVTGDQPMGDDFLRWREYSQTVPDFNAGKIVRSATVEPISDEVVAAYNAPYPDDSFKSGARIFPKLVPATPDDPSADACRMAWKSLATFEKPFLTAFSDSDPITKGGEKIFQKKVPGAAGQAHVQIVGGGHFLQEDRPQELAELILNFIAKT